MSRRVLCIVLEEVEGELQQREVAFPDSEFLVADLEKLRRGLVLEFDGNVEFIVNMGLSGSQAHANTVISTSTDNATVSLNPFVVTPKVQGFYRVYHHAQHIIYGSGAGGYTVNCFICGKKIHHNVALAATTHDTAEVWGTRLIYCNGTTDTITITYTHTFAGNLRFGSAMAENSEAYTVITYAGYNNEHGSP